MIRQELNPVTCKLDENDVGVLGLGLPSQWKIAGTPDWSGLVSPPIASVSVGSRLAMVLLPPALFKKGEEGRRKKEVLHLSRCYTRTHTHTHPAEPGKPWKARGRKKRTHDGPTAKNSAGRGGEQTDLRNQPTRRNGPDKTRAHLNQRHTTEKPAGG